MEIEALTSAIGMCKNAVGLLKEAKNLLPDSKEKKQAEIALEQAGKSFAIAEAKVAQELGFSICQCDWPPPICLRKSAIKIECPKCGRNVLEDFQQTSGRGCY